MAVYLVAEHIGIHAFCDFHNLPQQFRRHQCTGGIIGIVDADQLCPGHRQLPQLLQSRQVAVLRGEIQESDLRTVALGNGVKLLVGRHDADDPVTGLHQGIKHMVIGSRRTVGCDHFLRFQRLIEPADALPEGRCSLDVSVGETAGGKPLPKGTAVFSAQLEQLIDRDGIDTGFGNVAAGARFIGIHPFFHGKGSDLHLRILL